MSWFSGECLVNFVHGRVDRVTVTRDALAPRLRLALALILRPSLRPLAHALRRIYSLFHMQHPRRKVRDVEGQTCNHLHS